MKPKDSILRGKVWGQAQLVVEEALGPLVLHSSDQERLEVNTAFLGHERLWGRVWLRTGSELLGSLRGLEPL